MKPIQIFTRALAALVLSSFALAKTQAETYTVNTSGDFVVANACENHQSNCSLRGAILAANAHSGDTIVFNIIEFCGEDGCFIGLLSALPDISAPMSISGPSSHAIQRSSSAATNFRIFNVTTTGTVNISNLTIKQGSTGANGGAINFSSNGTLNISNCLFTGNVAQRGGAIHHISSAGILNVTNCTFSGNSANDSGGGIFNDLGTLNVVNCTFTANLANQFGVGDNSAVGGGAIANGEIINFHSAALNVTNSTFSGNMAFNGGAISTVANSVVKVSNCTLTGNHAFFTSKGGGISTDSNGPVTVKSSIIARSLNGPNNRDVSGAFISEGFNLIGKIDGSTGLTAATDQTGTIASPLDPKLDPTGLQNNGGPTQTIAVLFGSPAIDKGTSNSLAGALTTDQRGNGFPRALDYSSITNAAGGDGTDIGAIEFGGPLVPVSASRKAHGATPFDVSLPLSGTAGIECRGGGAQGNHQLIMNFPASVSLTSASVTTGTGSVNNYSVNGPNVTVNLTGVANAQRIVVTLFGVNNGSNTGDVTIPMSMLLGDTSGNGIVNATDISQTKLKSGQAVDATNFRNDVTASNSINSADVSTVKLNSGTALP